MVPIYYFNKLPAYFLYMHFKENLRWVLDRPSLYFPFEGVDSALKYCKFRKSEIRKLANLPKF
jgi:hypothetical protein